MKRYTIISNMVKKRHIFFLIYTNCTRRSQTQLTRRQTDSNLNKTMKIFTAISQIFGRTIHIRENSHNKIWICSHSLNQTSNCSPDNRPVIYMLLADSLYTRSYSQSIHSYNAILTVPKEIRQFVSLVVCDGILQYLTIKKISLNCDFKKNPRLNSSL